MDIYVSNMCILWTYKQMYANVCMPIYMYTYMQYIKTNVCMHECK